MRLNGALGRAYISDVSAVAEVVTTADEASMDLNAGATVTKSRTWADELARCDREIAAALEALLTGSIPVTDAVLWYTDWCCERELLLVGSEGIQAWPIRAQRVGIRDAGVGARVLRLLRRVLVYCGHRRLRAERDPYPSSAEASGLRVLGGRRAWPTSARKLRHRLEPRPTHRH